MHGWRHGFGTEEERSETRTGRPVLENWKPTSDIHDMVDRALSRLLRQRLAQFPAVTLVVPRQCGKTTLARTLARRYFNLEAPEERTHLDMR